MPIITWSDSFSVNDPTIDAQHKKLFELINELNDSMEEGKSKAMLGRTLDALIDHARVHFVDEENAMERANYPGLAAHQDEHDFYVQKIFEFQNDYRGGKIPLARPLLDFLETWLVNHILKTDKAYVNFINIQSGDGLKDDHDQPPESSS